MALSATFVANFSSLYKELDKAEVRFKEVAVDAEKVQSSIQKIGERFSGAKVIEDAAKMAKAIEDIGGASILTEKEARRVNAALSEALEKAAKTGAPVTAEMKKLAAETAGAAQQGGLYSKVIDGIGTAAKAAAASFIALFAFQKIVEAGKQLMEFGGKMVDLSTKTGLSTDALQKFQYAGGQMGISLDTITGGALKLQKAIAGDEKSAAKAFESLGLSVSDLRKMSPDEQMATFAAKVGELGDRTQQTTVLAGVFGRSWGEMLPVMTKEFADLTEKANSLGVVIDKQTLASMDNLGDTVSDLGSVAFAALAKIITPLLPMLSGLAQVALIVANAFGDVLGKTIDVVGGALKWLASRVLDVQIAMAEGIAAAANYVPGLNKLTGVSDAYTTVADKLRKMQASLNTETAKAVPQTKAVGEASLIAAKETDKHAEAVASLVKELSGAGAIEKVRILSDAFKSLTPEQQNNRRVVDDVLGQYVKLREVVGDKVAPALETLFVKFGTLGNRTMEFSRNMWELREPIESVRGSIQALNATPLTIFSTLAPSLKSMNVSAATLGGTVKGSLSESFTQLPNTILSALQGGGDVMASVGSLFGSGLGSSIVKNFGGKITEKLGSTMGGALNAVMPGLGALAGAKLGEGMSKAIGWIKGLFSDPMKKEIAAANKEIDKLKTAMLEQVGGSIDQLEEKYNALGLSIREAFAGTGKQGLEALKAVQDEFNKRLEESKTKLEDLRGELENLKGDLDGVIGKAYEMGYAFNEQGELVGFNFDKVASVAKEFGVDLAALGPAFQQAQLTAESQKVIDAFTLLTMSGADAGAVLVGMTDEINKIVNDSLKFGTVIPANMKPWVEKLFETGQLTDANGKKIGDLSKIKFGEPVKTEYEKINGAIQTILTAMNDLIGKIDSLVSAIDAAMRDRTVTFRAAYEDPGPPPGFGETRRDGNGGRGADAERAVGSIGATGRWFENFGAGRLVRLHGQESVVRRDQAAAFAADMGGGADVAAEVSALRSDLNDALPRAIARAMRDALQLAGAV